MSSYQIESKIPFVRDSQSNQKSQTLQSRDLLRNAREVLIQHGSQLYRLRHTRAGKLILTK
jgi:hemin uptake protein HemP